MHKKLQLLMGTLPDVTFEDARSMTPFRCYSTILAAEVQKSLATDIRKVFAEADGGTPKTFGEIVRQKHLKGLCDQLLVERLKQKRPITELVEALVAHTAKRTDESERDRAVFVFLLKASQYALEQDGIL